MGPPVVELMFARGRQEHLFKYRKQHQGETNCWQPAGA